MGLPVLGPSNSAAVSANGADKGVAILLDSGLPLLHLKGAQCDVRPCKVRFCRDWGSDVAPPRALHAFESEPSAAQEPVVCEKFSRHDLGHVVATDRIAWRCSCPAYGAGDTVAQQHPIKH